MFINRLQPELEAAPMLAKAGGGIAAFEASRARDASLATPYFSCRKPYFTELPARLRQEVTA